MRPNTTPLNDSAKHTELRTGALSARSRKDAPAPLYRKVWFLAL